MLNTITIILLQMAILLSSAPHSIDTDLDGVLRLAQYASWPNETDEMKILIATKDNNSYQIAEEYLKKKTFNSKKIKTEILEPDSNLDGVMIIYIEAQAPIDVSELTEKLNNKKILTISNDIDNLSNGCMFYINNTPEMLDYKYNKQAVINSGLIIRSSVLSPYHCYGE